MCSTKIYSAYIENGTYNYPEGFSNRGDSSTADIFAKELFLKSVANEQYLDNHDRCLSLVEFLKGETSISSALSRSIFDVSKPFFYKKDSLISKDFDIFSISYDDLEKYTISVDINTSEDNVLLSIHCEEKLLSVLVDTTSKSRTKLRKILKRMQ